MAGTYENAGDAWLFQIVGYESTVFTVNLKRSETIVPGSNWLLYAWRYCGQAIAGTAVLVLALGAATAQDAEPAAPEAPPVLPQILFVEMPIPYEPELDPVLPEVPPIIDPEDDPEFIARMNIIADYQLAVEDTELEGGAWDQGLIEELSSLGILQQQQGNHAEAIEIFDRAIHVNRINSGLYTLEQIPAVEKMIDSHLALGNWEEADTYYDYLFYIQQRAYGPHDPRMIPVLDRLAHWNIQAFNIGFGEGLGIRLSTAQIMLSAAARMVSVHFGEDDERFITYRRNIANSAFLASRNPELMAATQHQDYRSAQEALLTQLDARSFVTPMGFQAGERALRDIVRHYASQEGAQFELASAIADLADWHLLFERRRPAAELYGEAWDILQQSEQGEEWIQQLFGQVVPIPTFLNGVENLLSKQITTADGNSVNYDYADVVFDVTVYGTTRNITIQNEVTPYNSAQLGSLQSEIRDSFFRPRMENRELQRSERNYFRYRYWY